MGDLLRSAKGVGLGFRSIILNHEGGWSSGHGLTPKSLGSGGLKFKSCNGKHLGNSSMLSAYTH